MFVGCARANNIVVRYGDIENKLRMRANLIGYRSYRMHTLIFQVMACYSKVVQSIIQWIHTTLSPTTCFCHVKYQGNLTSTFYVNYTRFKTIAENRLRNRLKYNTPGAHLHRARGFIIEISNW